MVNTRGKQRTDSSASGDEGTSHPMEEPNADDQFEDNVEISVQEADDKGPQEFPGQEESEKVTEVSNNDVNISATEMSNENKAESDENISEDDEMDNQEDLMWDDEDDTSEEDNEDNVGGWDGASEDSGKEEDDEDEVSADEALEEEDYNEDEVDRDKAAKVAEGNEREVKAKEDKRKTKENADQKEAKAKEDERKAIDEEEGEEGEEEDEEEEDDDDDERKAKEEEEDQRKAKGAKDERKAKVKEDERGAKVKEGGKEPNDNRNDRQTADLKNDKVSNERSKKKKVRQVMPQKVDTKDKPESSQKRKRKKRVESMGMIFMCSSMTKNDCYQYGVLGLPESKKDIVEKIYTGMRLFLYDVDLKLLYGIYKAAGPGGYNIEPKAFKSHFPAQVRFSVLDDCLPLPEEKFKKVIKENYFTKTKFDCQLKADQVKKLCKLFVISSKGHLPQKSGGPRWPEKKLHPSRQERSKRRVRLGEDRHPPLREETRYCKPHARKHESRPHKRLRKAVVRSPLHSQPLPRAPLAYAYDRTTSDVDAYRRDPYPYRDAREPATPVVILRDTYVDGRDRYLDRRDSYYRDGWDPYTERQNPYREAYVDRRAPPSYLEHRDQYEDGRGLDLGIHGSFREGRDLYLERRDPSRDAAYVEPSYGGGHRRVPLLSDRGNGYREGQYLERGDVHRSLSLESRYRPAIGGRDSFVSTGQPLVYDDPIYSGGYPSRAGVAREYHL